MTNRFSLIIVLVFLIGANGALASVNYNAAHPTATIYNYRTQAPHYLTQYGYGQGYQFSGSRVSNGYSPVDGYRLTDYGPYPYPSTARFATNPQFRGHFNAWDGTYRYGGTGALVNQQPRQTGGIVAYQYPRNPYTVNRGTYYSY